jgi:predicted secreted protein
MERENSEKPYLTGKFVIASLERTDPAQDDSTYSISLENDGEITVDPTAITEVAEA